MNTIWVNLLTFGAVALFVAAVASVVYDAAFRYRRALRERLDQLSGRTGDPERASLFDFKQLGAEAARAKNDWRGRWKDALVQAGLTHSTKRLLWIGAITGGLSALALVLMSGCFIVLPLALVPAVVAPLAYVNWRRGARIRKLAWQLPEVFDTMRRAVRAGQTVPAAIQIVADDFDPPISDEFRRCYEQQNLGMSYEAALRDLARRTGIMELRILVVALLVQCRTGGNLIELLNNLSTMVRKRFSLRNKVKALTGEGRLQALILIVLPALAFGIMLIVQPDYANTLLERPWLLVAAATGQLLGAVWIRRIVRFSY